MAEAEVTRWFTVRIPTIYKNSLTHHDWKSTPLHFALWTTGKLSDKSKLEIEKIASSVKKYSVSVKYASDIQDEVKSTGHKKLRDILNQYFISHTLSSGG